MRSLLLLLLAIGPVVRPDRLPASPSLAKTARHVRLAKSEPAANERVTRSPTMLKLWFTETVELSMSRIKVVDAGGRPVTIARPMHIAGEDAKTLMAAVGSDMAPGLYTVQWTVAGDDGHVMRGTYTFTVAGRE